MYQLSVLQNQWVILAFFGGIVLMLGLVLSYMTMWRPRKSSPEPISGGRELIKWIPWFIIVLIIAIVIFQVTYTIILSYYPPNM
jgi:uncharacterized membrane protein YadS